MRWILAAEVAFVLVFLSGVALVSVPAALIIGGLLGVVAAERASARLTPSRPARAVADVRERRAAA